MDHKHSKYLIIKFEELPRDEMNCFQCIPNIWVKDFETNHVIAAFPPIDYTDFEETLKNADQFPSEEWSYYRARVISGTGQFKDAMEKLDLVQKANSEYSFVDKNAEARGKKRKSDLSFQDHENDQLMSTPSTSRGSHLSRPILNESHIFSPNQSKSIVSNSENIETVIQTIDDIDIKSEDEDDDSETENEFTKMFKEIHKKQVEVINYVDRCRRECKNMMVNPECVVHENEDENAKENLRTLSMDNFPQLTYNYLTPGSNVRELLPNTGVYVREIVLNYAERSLKDAKSFGAHLLRSIFTRHALNHYSATTLKSAPGFKTLVDYIQQNFPETDRATIINDLQKARHAKKVKLNTTKNLP